MTRVYRLIILLGTGDWDCCLAITLLGIGGKLLISKLLLYLPTISLLE